MAHKHSILTVLDIMGDVSDQSAKRMLAKASRRLLQLSLDEAGVTKASSCNGVWLDSAERSYVGEGRKLNAVKAYKNRMNVTLMDAKHSVEDWMAANGYPRKEVY